MSFYGVTVSSAGDRRVQQRCDQSALPALSPLFGLWFLFPPRLPPPVGLRAASECARSQGVGCGALFSTKLASMSFGCNALCSLWVTLLVLLVSV
jgi:hypothetical protein